MISGANEEQLELANARADILLLQKEIQELKDKIKKLVKYAYESDMSASEFFDFYELATGETYNPKVWKEKFKRGRINEKSKNNNY